MLPEEEREEAEGEDDASTAVTVMVDTLAFANTVVVPLWLTVSPSLQVVTEMYVTVFCCAACCGPALRTLVIVSALAGRVLVNSFVT